MFEYVFPYLLASMVTLVAILTAIWAFILQRRRAVELDILEQRIPDAARYEDLKQRLLEVEDEWAEINEQFANAKVTIAQMEETERRLKDAREQLLSVEAEREQQEKLRAELEELQRRHSEEFERSANLRKELEGARFRLDKLKEEDKLLQSRMEDLRQEETNVQTSISSLKNERAKLEQLVETLKVQEESLQAQVLDTKEEVIRIRKERHDLEKEAKDLRQICAELNGEVAGLERNKERLLVDVGKQKDRLEDLWQPVLEPTRFKNHMPEDELECLEAAKSYMSELGLRFHDRVIKAFHTSLKVTDVSPLVVLAGISGTGKSELPRRYAEGTGMHFLNIAVQPRWDSPQDMFGFFNYLEGRYRATELARALVQMDAYYKKKGRGWDYPKGWEKNNLSPQMLLVLLDEMNLARIEYYFSEFLSRLEIRRGVNIEEDMDRRKAEIPLEVGGAGGADSILYLFANTNILFVGTMNEDETTQTLSDKVVDRANVLRFGKPSQLAREVLTTLPSPSKKSLPYGNWLEWVKQEGALTKKVSNEVNSWIDRLNAIMTLIHRPFAHRTHLAIRTYIANYPHDGDKEQAIRFAMADQIEQKILPKIRGLDSTEPSVSQALDLLCELLKELEDDLLVDTINSMRGSDEHLFSWQGVDRFNENKTK